MLESAWSRSVLSMSLRIRTLGGGAVHQSPKGLEMIPDAFRE